MSRFVIEQFDAQKLDATEAAWLASAQMLEIPDLDYIKQIQWISNNSDYSRTNNSLAYGLFDSTSPSPDVAVATLDLVHSKRVGGGWLKFLQLFLSPKFAPSVLAPAHMAEMFEIYSDSIIGTIALTTEHPSRSVKIYARDDHLMTLLAGVESTISKIPDSVFTAHFEGRFLVISTT